MSLFTLKALWNSRGGTSSALTLTRVAYTNIIASYKATWTAQELLCSGNYIYSHVKHFYERRGKLILIYPFYLHSSKSGKLIWIILKF